MSEGENQDACLLGESLIYAGELGEGGRVNQVCSPDWPGIGDTG